MHKVTFADVGTTQELVSVPDDVVETVPMKPALHTHPPESQSGRKSNSCQYLDRRHDLRSMWNIEM